MRTKKLFVTLSLLFLVVAWLGLMVHAQTKTSCSPPDNEVYETTVAMADLLKVSLALDAGILSRQKPAVATVTVENISGRSIDLKSICSFKMLRMDQEHKF